MWELSKECCNGLLESTPTNNIEKDVKLKFQSAFNFVLAQDTHH